MYREIIKSAFVETGVQNPPQIGLITETNVRATMNHNPLFRTWKVLFSAFALLFLLRLSGKEECWELVLSVCEGVTETDGMQAFREA